MLIMFLTDAGAHCNGHEAISLTYSAEKKYMRMIQYTPSGSLVGVSIEVSSRVDVRNPCRRVFKSFERDAGRFQAVERHD